MRATLADDVVHYFLAPNVGSAPVRGGEHLARYWRKVAGMIEARWVVDHGLVGSDQPVEAVIEWTMFWRPQGATAPGRHPRRRVVRLRRRRPDRRDPLLLPADSRTTTELDGIPLRRPGLLARQRTDSGMAATTGGLGRTWADTRTWRSNWARAGSRVRRTTSRRSAAVADTGADLVFWADSFVAPEQADAADAGRRRGRRPRRARGGRDRAGAHRHGDPHRAVPRLQGHRHPRPRLAWAGRAGRSPCRAPRRRRGSSAASPRRRPRCCGARRPRPSRWSCGCGTRGRTTRSSATSPPAATSTATACTTSTSSASSSR